MPDLSATDLRPFIPARDFALPKRSYAAPGWEARDVGPRLALVTAGDGQHFYVQDRYLKDVAENTIPHVTVENAADRHAHVATALQAGAFPPARVQPPARRPHGAAVVFVHDPGGVPLHLREWDR